MLFHPLSGSDLPTLVRVVAANGPVPLRQWPPLAIAAAASLARTPFSLFERAIAPAWTRIRGPMPAPVFIVGHWRSGTTHLYNLLSRVPGFGYPPPLATGLPWDMLLLARALRPALVRLLPEERFIDRIPVRADSPQEDEPALANMQELSFYHGLYFPRHLQANFDAGVFFDGATPSQIRRWRRRFQHLLDKLHVLNRGRRLLIKNPVHTTRIHLLRQMFPDARFVHVRRDPLTVLASMRHFYFRLLDQMGLQPYDPATIDELILRSYPRMMRQLETDAQDLERGRFVEIAYERLDEAPLTELERLYDELELPGFEEARPHFEAYLDRVSGYQKNQHELPDSLRHRAEAEWRPFIERWGAAASS